MITIKRVMEIVQVALMALVFGPGYSLRSHD
jgi:hypothetical protein